MFGLISCFGKLFLFQPHTRYGIRRAAVKKLNAILGNQSLEVIRGQVFIVLCADSTSKKSCEECKHKDSFHLSSVYAHAERHEAHLHQFEMLLCKGNSDNGYRADATEHEVNKRNFPPVADNPQDIEAYGEASGFFFKRHLLPERKQRKRSELEKLYAEWRADNRNAHQKPRCEIHQRDNQPSKKEPENISKQAHILLSRSPLAADGRDDSALFLEKGESLVHFLTVNASYCGYLSC